MEWEKQAESTLNAWAAAAQEGDKTARLALLRQFEPLIRSTAAWLWGGVIRSRLTTIYERADLTQETQRLFLELVHEHTLRRGRSFTPFIVTMLRWRARNFLAQAQRRRTPGRRQRIDDELTLEKVAQLGHALFPDPAAVVLQRTELLAAMATHAAPAAVAVSALLARRTGRTTGGGLGCQPASDPASIATRPPLAAPFLGSRHPAARSAGAGAGASGQWLVSAYRHCGFRHNPVSLRHSVR